MIIEQIRYFIEEANRAEVLEVRREITRIRDAHGIPGGHILLAETDGDEGPYLVWQCGYADEAEMGMAETRLIGNAEYESARERLGQLITRVELELYTAEET